MSHTSSLPISSVINSIQISVRTDRACSKCLRLSNRSLSLSPRTGKYKVHFRASNSNRSSSAVTISPHLHHLPRAQPCFCVLVSLRSTLEMFSFIYMLTGLDKRRGSWRLHSRCDLIEKIMTR